MRSSTMTEEHLPLNDLGELANEELAERRREVGDETQAQELMDVPSESGGDLDAQQAEKAGEAG
jgi:hypothetical protein